MGTGLWKEEENRLEEQVGGRREEEQGSNKRERITEGNGVKGKVGIEIKREEKR